MASSFARSTASRRNPQSRTRVQPTREKPSEMNTTATVTAFISGPLEPPTDHFTTHYCARIDAAIAAGHGFIIGPSRGIDALALAYLLRSVEPSRICVYLRESESRLTRRFVAQGVRVVVCGGTHTERDAAMTSASDYDILRYMTEAEARVLYGEKYRPRVSGTEKNEIRRREIAEAKRRAAEEMKEEKGQRKS